MDLTPIAELSPELSALHSRQFKAVITLLWPYSSSTRQCAVLLADSDIRRRRNRGQVRVRFSGSSARLIAKSGIGIGDEIVLGLNGAQFVRDNEEVRTPGKSIDWELEYKQTLGAQVFRDGNEFAKLELADAAPTPAPGSPVRQSLFETPFKTSASRLGESQRWTSPAFLKRTRLSDGPVFEAGGFDPLVEGAQENRTRKRPRKSYGDWNVWTYSGRTPSPEKDDVGSDVDYESIGNSPTRAQELPVTPVSPLKPLRFSVAAKPLEETEDTEVASEEPEENSSADASVVNQTEVPASQTIPPASDPSDFVRDADYYDLYAGPDEVPPWSQEFAQGGDTEPNTEEESEEDTQHSVQDMGVGDIASEAGEDEHENTSEAAATPGRDDNHLDMTASPTIEDMLDIHTSSREGQLPNDSNEFHIGITRHRERSGTAEDPITLDDAPQIVMPPPSLPAIQTQFQFVPTRGLLTPIGREPLSPVIKPLDSSTLPMPSPLPGDQDLNTSSYLDRVPPKETATQPSAPLQEEEPRSEPSYLEDSSFFSSVSTSKAPAFHPTHESAFTDVRFTFGIDESVFSRQPNASQTPASIESKGQFIEEESQAETHHSEHETVSYDVGFGFGFDGSTLSRHKDASATPNPAESVVKADHGLIEEQGKRSPGQNEHESTEIDDSSVRFSFGMNNAVIPRASAVASSPIPEVNTTFHADSAAQPIGERDTNPPEINDSSVRFSFGQSGAVSYPPLPDQLSPVAVEDEMEMEHQPHDTQGEPEDLITKHEDDRSEYENVQFDDQSIFDSFTVQDDQPLEVYANNEAEEIVGNSSLSLPPGESLQSATAMPSRVPEVIVLSSDDESEASEDDSEQVSTDEESEEDQSVEDHSLEEVDEEDESEVEESEEEKDITQVTSSPDDEHYRDSVHRGNDEAGAEDMVPHQENQILSLTQDREDAHLAEAKDPQSIDALLEAALEAASPAPPSGTDTSNVLGTIIDLGSGSEDEEEEDNEGPLDQPPVTVSTEHLTSDVGDDTHAFNSTRGELDQQVPPDTDHIIHVKLESHEDQDGDIHDDQPLTKPDEDDIMVDVPPMSQDATGEPQDIKMESIEDEPTLILESQYRPGEGSMSVADDADEMVIAVPEEGHKLGEMQLISVASSAPARNTRSKTKASLSPTKDSTPAPQARLNTRRSKLLSTSRARTTLSPIDQRSRSTLSPTRDVLPESPYSLRSRSRLQSHARSTTPPATNSKVRTGRAFTLPTRDSSPESISDHQHPKLPDMSFGASQELGTSQGKFAHVSYVKDSEEGSLHSEHSLSTMPYSDDYEPMGSRQHNMPSDHVEPNNHNTPAKPVRSYFTHGGTKSSRRKGAKFNRDRHELSPEMDEDEVLPGEVTPKASVRDPAVEYPDLHIKDHTNSPQKTIDRWGKDTAIPQDQVDPEDQVPSSPPLQPADLSTSVNAQSLMNSHLPITPNATQQSFAHSQPGIQQSHAEHSLPMSPELTQATSTGLHSFKQEVEMEEVTTSPMIRRSPVTKTTSRVNATSTDVASPERSPSIHSEDLSASDTDMPPTDSQLPTIGLSTPISYYTPLKDLTFFLNRSSQHHGGSNPDILALVTKGTTLPKRAEKGPRHYNTTLHITDLSSHPTTTSVQIFRLFSSALPVAEAGDVILLRRFSVKSLNRKVALISGEESSWCVWRWGKPLWGRKSGAFGEVRAREEIRGPPVEKGEGEWGEVERLRRWWKAVVRKEAEGKEVEGVETRSRGKGMAAVDSNDRM